MTDAQASPIRRVAAQVAAMAGFRVDLFDADPAQVERGMERVRDTLRKGVERGKVTPAMRDGALERLHPASSVRDAAAEADLLIEAVPERMELKEEVFREADRAAPPHAVLATNTSSLSVSRIAADTERPERVIGLHFFNPVHLMKLLEVVRGEATTQEVVEMSLGFARADRQGADRGHRHTRLRLLPARRGARAGGDADGRAGGRLARRHRPGDGAGVQPPDGPAPAHRRGGARRAARDRRVPAPRPWAASSTGRPEILRRMVAEGKLGKKSGQGFYPWEEV
jgi:3-hydroxybutyryl-CoA dehydrogenase